MKGRAMKTDPRYLLVDLFHTIPKACCVYAAMYYCTVAGLRLP